MGGHVNQLSPEDTRRRDDRIVELSVRGLRPDEIAGAVGVTARTVARARRRRGVSAPPAPRLTVDELELARGLLADGASYGEVARTLGRSHFAIAKNFPGASVWDRRAGGQLGIRLARLGITLKGQTLE